MSRLWIAVQLIVVAFVARGAFAEFLYIVPAIGYARSADAVFYSTIRVINPGSAAAHVSVDGYTMDGQPCTPKPFDVAAGESVSTTGLQCGFGISAVVFRSDQPLYILPEILGLNQICRECAPYFERQQIAVARSWIAASQEAIVPEIEILPLDRANLFIVNPNDQPLHVRLRVERPEFHQSYDDTLTVAPRSLRMYAVREIPWTGPPSIDPLAVTGIHVAHITADLPYQAGASAVHRGGDGTWREAVPLAP